VNPYTWSHAITQAPPNTTPVLLSGLDTLKSKISAQSSDAEKLLSYEKGLRGAVTELKYSTEETQKEAARLQRRKAEIEATTLRVMRKVEVMRQRGLATNAGEREFFRRIQELGVGVERAGNGVKEVAGMAVRHVHGNKHGGGGGGGGGGDGDGDAGGKLSAKDGEAVRKVLVDQNNGIEILRKTMLNDMRDVEIMKEREGKRQQQRQQAW